MAQKVLLVEDDFFIRDVYRMALEQKGYQVLLAEDGKQALEIYDRELPDLVLLDIMLPRLGGMEVLKYIRKKADKTGKTPVIMMTNLDTAESVEQAMELGATQYWLKSTKDPIAVASEINHYFISD